MSKNKSFTLIELLVVIVIIGILASVIIVSTSSSISKANFAKAKAFSANIKDSMMLDLVSEWTFDEPEENGKTKDGWGSSHGTVVGATQVDDCVFGKCYSFDGSFNHYIRVLAIPSLSTGKAFMLSAWVCPERTNTYRAIMGYNSRHRLLIGSNGVMLSEQEGDGSSALHSDAGVVNQKWTHVVYWYNGLEERWYINGNLSGNPHVFSSAEWNQAFYIGQYNLSYYPYKGKIDEVKVHNNVFSAKAIKKEYLSGLNSLLVRGSISKEKYNQKLVLLKK